MQHKSTVLVFILCFFAQLPGMNLYAQEKKIIFGTANQESETLFNISNTILTEAFQRLGYTFELRSFPPKRAPKEANSGKVDGDAHRIYAFNKKNTYPNLIRVEEPVQSIERCVFTKNSNLDVQNWSSLAPFKVLYVEGIAVDEKGLDSGNVPIENRHPVTEVTTAFKMLASGRGDLVITSAASGLDTIRLLQLKNSGIKRVGRSLQIIHLYPFIHKKHLSLAPGLADKIREMKKDGTYAKLLIEIRQEQ